MIATILLSVMSLLSVIIICAIVRYVVNAKKKK